MRTTHLLAATLMAGALALVGGPAQAADDAHVSILHGVPGATVDVYVNGDELLSDFEPGTLTDPVALPGGDYDLKVVAAGDGPGGDAIMEANGVTVPAGANITVVAHLDADGNPALTPFVNDTSAIAAGEARLTVRHTAAARLSTSAPTATWRSRTWRTVARRAPTCRPARSRLTSCSPARTRSRSARLMST